VAGGAVYLFEKYIIRLLLSQFLFYWVFIVVFLMLVKFQSFSHLNWPFYFQFRFTLAFLAQIMSLSAPFALGFAAIKWHEKMHELKCFEAASSLGYTSQRFIKMKWVMVAGFVLLIWGLMNVVHPILNQNQGQLLRDAANYLGIFKSGEFSIQPVNSGGQMVLYHRYEDGKYQDYFIQLSLGDHFTYYWVDEVGSRNDGMNWVLEFGKGRQFKASLDHIMQWSAFGSHVLSLPLLTDQSQPIAALSMSQFDETLIAHRQEKFLRIALGVFVGLIGYLMIYWPKYRGRIGLGVWPRNLALLLVSTLMFLALMALVSQGFIAVQTATGLLFVILGLRWINAMGA
jgi:hypothetical protein